MTSRSPKPSHISLLAATVGLRLLAGVRVTSRSELGEVGVMTAECRPTLDSQERWFCESLIKE